MRLHLAIFFLLLAAAAAPAPAAVTLHVSAAQHYEAPGPDANAPADRTVEMDVTLGDTYIQIDSDHGRMIYDFQSRRRYAVDPAAKIYVEYSLYDLVGFRVMEMKNRETLQQALAAAKVSDRPMVTADLENQLSIFKDGPSQVEEKTAGGMHEFSIGGARLASWSEGGTKVSAADAARFAQFLRYAEAGHPQLLERLAQGGMIPERLALYLNGLGPVGTVTLRFSAVLPAQSPAYDLKPYRREAASGGIDGLLDRIAAMTPEQLAAFRAQHPCETSDSGDDFSAARVVETMLGRLECALSTGTPLSLTPEQKEAVGASAPLGLLFASLNPSKQDEYANSIKTLQALREQAPRKAYVLKVFEANNRARMGQVKEAQQLFVEALEANPALAGAYKDLGDVLLMQYDSPRAWRCWDAGRRLAPSLSNFEPVNKFERDLAAQHPRYF
ncbi:hypothetical protein [Duganella callida]|uniref:Uncharacterized protein n=1 Tax=Duganella callida TaxID=2561932 RepID=A0A4Y9S2L1_9BURK|nr:hypothetical protein [Duganella callida]TFW15542.1 hypothetical protein E4L98_26545 [Duganella callida]